jgi:small conductance mechanosensitive channel
MPVSIPAWLIPDSENFGVTLARLALTLLVAWVLQRAGFLLVWRAERWLARAAKNRPAAQQRARTLAQTTRHLVTTIVGVGAVIHGLEILGWDVKPLLVGASILGAALGFGAQSLVRDVIAGACILVEDQFSVGDAVEVNGVVATVEDVTLRSTRLRDYRGRLLFVANGEMRIVINHSRDWHRSLVDVPLAPDQDLALVLRVAGEAAAALAEDPRLAPGWLEPPQVAGIERVGPDGVTLRFVMRTAPGAAAATAARETLHAALTRLRESGVRLANVSPRGPEPGKCA